MVMNASSQVLKIVVGAALSLMVNAVLAAGCFTAVLLH